jgi:hypothetical protein
MGRGEDPAGNGDLGDPVFDLIEPIEVPPVSREELLNPAQLYAPRN